MGVAVCLVNVALAIVKDQGYIPIVVLFTSGYKVEQAVACVDPSEKLVIVFAPNSNSALLQIETSVSPLAIKKLRIGLRKGGEIIGELHGPSSIHLVTIRYSSDSCAITNINNTTSI